MRKALQLALGAGALVLASCGGGGTKASVEPLTFTVTFDSGFDGVTVPSQTVSYGEYATDPGRPSGVSGYRFDGWFIDTYHVTAFDFQATAITADWTLYAGWTSNGGSSSSSEGGSTSSTSESSSNSEISDSNLYFKDAGWWAKDGAYTAIYTWGGSGPAFPGTVMECVGTRSDAGENIWSIDSSILDGVTGFIFVRVSSAGEDWNAKTVDLSPTDASSSNLYDISASPETWGDPGATGSWSTYNG